MPRSRTRSRKRSGSRYRSHGPLASDATRVAAVAIAKQLAESNAPETSLLKLEYAGYDSDARRPCLIVRYKVPYVLQDTSNILDLARPVGDPVLHARPSGMASLGTIHLFTKVLDVSTLQSVRQFLQGAAKTLTMPCLRFDDWFGVSLPVYGTLHDGDQRALEEQTLKTLRQLTRAHSQI
jgi:hypothetical protein